MTKIDTVTQDFTNPGVPYPWLDHSYVYAPNQGSVTVVNGRAEIRSGSAVGAAGELMLAQLLDITASSAYVRCQPPGSGPYIGAFFIASIRAAGTGDGYEIEIQSNGTSAFFMVNRIVGSVGTTVLGPITYSATNHKWFRFRESGGTMFCETAPDSGNGPGSWTTQFSESYASANAQFDPTNILAFLNTTMHDAGGELVLWDGFNTNVCPKLRTLVYGFDGPLLPREWTTVLSGGTADISSGQLRLTSGAAGGSYAALQGPLADIQNSSMYVRCQPPGSGQYEALFYILDAALNGYRAVVFNDGAGSNLLQLYRYAAGTPTLVASTTYDAVNHKWLGLAEQSGTFFFLTAADAGNYPGLFTVQFSEATNTNASFNPQQVAPVLYSVTQSTPSIAILWNSMNGPIEQFVKVEIKAAP